MDFAQLNTRSMGDILDAERQVRQAAENDIRQYVALLTRLAQMLLGNELDAARQADPSAPKYWTAQDWNSFFSQIHRNLTIVPPTDRWNPSSVLHNGNGPKETAERSALEEELQKARANMERLQTAVATLQQQLSSTTDTGIVSVKSPPSVRPKADERQKPAAKNISRPTGDNPLLGFTVPGRPLAFNRMMNGRNWSELRWRRGSMALYLIASLGLSAVVEVDRHIAPVEKLSQRTNSIRKPVDQFVEAGILVSDALKVTSGINSVLRVVRLTQKGREFCQMLGWEPVQSDWERLIELHQGERMEAHTVAVLLFAMHARARGWSTEVMPPVAGRSIPDIRVWRDDASHYVEVELGKRDRPAKWKHLDDLQGYVALCAGDMQGRQRLVGDCKLAKHKGVATDLKTLDVKRIYEITPDDPLWIEEWK